MLGAMVERSSTPAEYCHSASGDGVWARLGAAAAATADATSIKKTNLRMTIPWGLPLAVKLKAQQRGPAASCAAGREFQATNPLG
jgi:hypothetical protein